MGGGGVLPQIKKTQQTAVSCKMQTEPSVGKWVRNLYSYEHKRPSTKTKWTSFICTAQCTSTQKANDMTSRITTKSLTWSLVFNTS